MVIWPTLQINRREKTSTHQVHPCTPHEAGTPLENSGTPWGVRYTRLTSTALSYNDSTSGRFAACECWTQAMQEDSEFW